ncbi:uncharacterized protein DUF5004 [Alteromonadaceae bacterium 2753L.S.0a.02]|nr:uncharacterized protein DUF5004 [Alteromonadaceae bacterium 2753L.S.0a.02]TVZ40854.1 uncharacterized protein DUF5004 [Alteromonadaceae bacterium 2753L.S.0a.02]
MVDYDTRLAAQRESITTINSDGSFDIESRQTTGVSEYIHTESGTWKCTGKEYIFYTNIINGVESENTVMYEIIELTESYQKSSTINEDCESVITDCPATYEFMRIQ